MAEQNPAVYLVDMVGACEKILRYCENRTVAEFVDDTLLFDAVLRNLTVLGEAAGRLDRPWTDRYSDVPWAAITGIRHRVVHDYGHVDPDIVWDTVQEDVPAILNKLKRILSDMGSGTL
jgi:uncharacterized protein with HEPN domain